MIVSEAKMLTRADGGTLYITKENALHFKIIHTDSLNIHLEVSNYGNALLGAFPTVLYSLFSKPLYLLANITTKN